MLSRATNAQDKPLLDFVFAVSHPSHWHAINMQQHPDHYSLPMRLLGSNAVAWMQEKGLGAEVWFNVDVEINGKVRCARARLSLAVKPAVLTAQLAPHPTVAQVWCDLGRRAVPRLARLGDALHLRANPEAGTHTCFLRPFSQHARSLTLCVWRLYLPLQVKILHDDARVRLANQVNLASALRAALLLLPEEFTEIELFEEIAGLSYRGDFRMRVGENPHKVRNIVAAQLPAFRSLYGGLIKSFWKSVHTIGEDFTPTEAYPFVEEMGGIRLMRQNLAPAVRGHTASRLPIGLREKVLGHYERKWNLEGALLRQRDQKAHDAEREEGGAQRIDLESSKMWERIVADPEFRQVMDKSESGQAWLPFSFSFARILWRTCLDSRSLTKPTASPPTAPNQASRRSSPARRSTNPSRASSPPDRSNPSATSVRNCAKSGSPLLRPRPRLLLRPPSRKRSPPPLLLLPPLLKARSSSKGGRGGGETTSGAARSQIPPFSPSSCLLHRPIPAAFFSSFIRSIHT